MGFARYFLVLNLVLAVLASKDLSQNLNADSANRANKAQNLDNFELSFEACESAESPLDSAKCEETIAYLEKSCAKRGAQACTALGYLYENGLGAELDTAHALSYYARACDLRASVGCVNAGAIYAEAEKYADAASYFVRACELRNADGCFNAGVGHLYGQGVVESEFLAKIYFNDAIRLYNARCERDDASACEMLAKIYNDGIVAEGNARKAEWFAKKACEIEGRFCEK